MGAATDVADALATKLFSLGYYKFAGSEPSSFVPAASLEVDLPAPVQSVFGGLSVAGIGVAEGSEKDGLYVYATRVSKTAIRDFPREISGVAARLAGFGNIDVRPEAALAASSRPKCYTLHGRIACGSSAAPAGSGYSGTFGALCLKQAALFGLSNNHVFGECNHTPLGHPILSPSANDTGAGLPYPDSIFRHSQFAPLHSGDPLQMAPSKLDAAIAEVLSVDRVTSMQGTFYDTPTTTTDPAAGMAVKKVGRTTGLTAGIVEARLVRIFALPYKAAKFKATVYFEDIWTVRGTWGNSFAAPGDSGSLVVTEDEAFAVGLLFAVSSTGLGVIIPIQRVLQYFGVRLANGIP